MRIVIVVVIFIIGCSGGNHEKEMPDSLRDLILVSQKSPDHLKLNLELEELESDSLIVSLFLENNSTMNDTLYHSSNFPLHVIFSGEKEITHPIQNQFFFDDLESTIVFANSKKMIQNIRIRKLSDSSYKVISLFRYRENSQSSDNLNLWLVSEPKLMPD